MRDDESRSFQDLVRVQEQVEVESARPVRFPPDPAKAALHVEQEAEEVIGGKVGLDFGGGIEVGPLPRRAADRRGLMVGGDFSDGDSGVLAQGLNRPVEIRAPVAEVAPQGEVSSDGR
jgi:hypothetical protein